MSQKEWTIMIYMAGDNNLAVDMAYAMEQIKQVADQGEDSPNLFVYYDGNSPAIPTLYCDFSDAEKPRYVRSCKVPNKLYRVPEKANENAADPRSIINFVDWCVNTVEVKNNGQLSFGRRAQKYALIFSGHSLGFQDIGLFKDESTGKTMKMNDFYWVLQTLIGKKRVDEFADEKHFQAEGRELAATKLLDQKLDILGFDSCVMGMLEVGYQFSDAAKTMIASEGSVPSAGWTYAKILGCLTGENQNNDNHRRVAERFVKEFIRSQDSYTVGGVSVDMAAWDLKQFDELAAAFDALARILLACFEDESSRIYRQMERVILQVHWKCQSYMFDQSVDVGDFCELLDQECESVLKELGTGDDLEILLVLRHACQNVLNELKNAVILSGFSGGGYQYSNGVSVFFPWSRDAYEVSAKNYESLLFAKKTDRKYLSWTDFLRKYLYEVTFRPVVPTDESVPAGSRIRYPSGVPLDERFETSFFAAAAAAPGNGTRISGQENTRIAGQENTRIAGQENTRIAGQENTRIAGQENTRIAGGGGNRFFDSLKLFKNIESRWDISGFTKKTE